MTVNRRVTGRASTMPVGLTMAALASLGVTFAGAALTGYLISRDLLQESSIGYCAMALILLSSVTGAAVAVGKIKRQRVLVCGISGAIYFAVLLSMTALVFGGQYQGIGVTALLVLAGSVLVVLLGLRGEKKPKYRKRKISNR